MTRILVTGFVAYREHHRNPSEVIARDLDASVVGGAQIVGRVLPVSYRCAEAALKATLVEVDPAALLMLGLFPSRPRLTIERVAVNLLDFPFPDNDGDQPVDLPIVAHGPAAYLSLVDVRDIVRRWQAAGLDGEVSYTAGTYVCNQSFYLASHITASQATPVGFIHLPPVRDAAAPPGSPGITFDAMFRGVRMALSSLSSALSSAAPARSPPDRPAHEGNPT